MAERRKIVVPIGDEPETPHFDAEETLLSARPVVPLRPGMAEERFESPATGARPPFHRRFSFLALIVLAAVAIGVAAGLGIARYRYQSRSAAPVAAQPAPAPAQTDARTATIQAPKQSQPSAPLPEVKTDEKTSDDVAAKDEPEKTKADEKAKESSKATESKDKNVDDRKDENVKITQPIVAPPAREKKRPGDDDVDVDAPRSQKPRAPRRTRDDETVDVQRSIQRAGEQINRIREIFEGRQQRP